MTSSKKLPPLFTIEPQLIQPFFQSFYYMHFNIYTLHGKMQNGAMVFLLVHNIHGRTDIQVIPAAMTPYRLSSPACACFGKASSRI
jgi:hypothetical protein